ncbi:MAG: hypothetical protein WD872_16760, partial [Pirellulaceae bacterium]
SAACMPAGPSGRNGLDPRRGWRCGQRIGQADRPRNASPSPPNRIAKNKQLEIDATEIRIRAERRLGELIAEQKATAGMNKGAVPGKTGSKGVPVLDDRPTLAAAGIDKHLADRAQKLAAVPEAEFEQERFMTSRRKKGRRFTGEPRPVSRKHFRQIYRK